MSVTVGGPTARLWYVCERAAGHPPLPPRHPLQTKPPCDAGRNKGWLATAWTTCSARAHTAACASDRRPRPPPASAPRRDPGPPPAPRPFRGRTSRAGSMLNKQAHCATARPPATPCSPSCSRPSASRTLPRVCSLTKGGRGRGARGRPEPSQRMLIESILMVLWLPCGVSRSQGLEIRISRDSETLGERERCWFAPLPNETWRLLCTRCSVPEAEWRAASGWSCQ